MEVSLLTLIEELFDYSEIENETLELDRVSFNLNKFIESFIGFLYL